jgi:lipid II:glycine glycyltransferase (peptidoglycan interpeptide bridge formation enzyme)
VTLHLIQVTEQTEWDAALASLPLAHVLQTWGWGDFKSRWGWQPVRLLLQTNGEPVAAAQVLRRRLPHTPFSIAYVPKGPSLNYEDTSLLVQVLSALEQYTRQRGCLFMKIDPDVWLGRGEVASPPGPETAAILRTLAEHGWRPSPQQIQFRNTVILDLKLDEEMMLAQMKPKTRYNIRLGTRRGVHVRQGTEHDLDTFYSLYRQTSDRNVFLIRPSAYYLDVWAHFLQAGRARLLLAEVESELVAGLMLFYFGQTAWYLYGASSNRYRELMPNYLLQWEAIRLASRLGCAKYDMWGAPDRFDESDLLWGVYRFKTGFGGDTMRGIGAYDYTPSPIRYWLYSIGMPRLLGLMRRRL